MEALVIDRATPADTLFTLMRASRIRVEGDADRLILTPARTEADDEYIDPDDYDSETDYVNAIPGLAELLIASANAPASEFVDVPDDWIDRSGLVR